MKPAAMSAGLRILVVEDVQDSAESLALLIGLWGHQAIVAYDGPSALEAASAHPPDVVLLDIGLPRMNGYEVARRLRQLPEMAMTLQVAITGYGQESDVRRCKEAGIDIHFLKPVDPMELRQVLAKAKKRGEKAQQLAC